MDDGGADGSRKSTEAKEEIREGSWPETWTPLPAAGESLVMAPPSSFKAAIFARTELGLDRSKTDRTRSDGTDTKVLERARNTYLIWGETLWVVSLLTSESRLEFLDLIWFASSSAPLVPFLRMVTLARRRCLLCLTRKL